MPGCKGFWEGELPPSRRWGLQEPCWLSISCIINHPKTWWPKWTAFLLISQFLGVGHSVRRSTVGTRILPLLATSGVSAGSLKGCGQNPGAPVRSHGWWVLLAICQDLCWAEGRTPFTRTPTRCGASMQLGGGVPQTSTLRESTQSLLIFFLVGPSSEVTWLHCVFLRHPSKHSQPRPPRLSRRDPGAHLSLGRATVSSKKRVWGGTDMSAWPASGKPICHGREALQTRGWCIKC